MRCFEMQAPHSIEGLKLVDSPTPQPGPGQVLVRIKAATLNYRDLLTIKGGYGSRQKFPLLPVSDGAGVAEAAGAGVREFAPGVRVVGSFFETWIGGEPSAAKIQGALGSAVDGVLAEYRVFPSQALVRTPDPLTDVEAAALPCAGLTAWSAVVKLGGVKAGQTVLTQGTGGVSIFALQFAKMCGARVIATSSSDAKLERLKSLGADVTINYRTVPDWGRMARELAGQGVDLVVEVGGVGTLNESIRAIRIGGTIAFIGVLAGPPPPAIDGDAAAASAGRNCRVGRRPAGDVRRDRHQQNEAGDRQDVPVRPGCGGIPLHGKRITLRKSGHRGRMHRFFPTPGGPALPFSIIRLVRHAIE
jgi:NADPH:quinone reductase-like Zn-dependent oxidoreductase